MSVSLSWRSCCLALLFLPLGLLAQLSLPVVFSDNMVLQREKPLPVWGEAAPNAMVTVSFLKQQKTATADAQGKWSVQLDPLQASAVPTDLMVTGESTITFHNVLVGDVWLCSGQSNMEYPLDRKLKKYAAPQKMKDPYEGEQRAESRPDGIRYLYVDRVLNKYPALPSKGWVNGQDTIVPYVSAIGYYFGREIFEQTKIPIGIISTSWGGTRIEQWTPEWAYQQSPVFRDSVTSPQYKIDGMHPGQMYRGMVEPLLPFAVKGVLWYQGESNCMIEDQATYPEKFRVFAQAWRDLFKDPKLPFFTVQIAPFLYSTRKDKITHTAESLPLFWEAQTKCLSVVPQTYMVVTTDLVDKLTDIHPSYKWVVAHRLALQALENAYSLPQVAAAGPLFESAKRHKNSIELRFANTGTGLASSDGKPLTWFSVAGKDGKFLPAVARIDQHKIFVSAEGLRKPKHLRFAWDETAQPNFTNKEGLPAYPFRTR